MIFPPWKDFLLLYIEANRPPILASRAANFSSFDGFDRELIDRRLAKCSDEPEA
jgi:hypothetical protein